MKALELADMKFATYHTARETIPQLRNAVYFTFGVGELANYNR